MAVTSMPSDSSIACCSRQVSSPPRLVGGLSLLDHLCLCLRLCLCLCLCLCLRLCPCLCLRLLAISRAEGPAWPQHPYIYMYASASARPLPPSRLRASPSPHASPSPRPPPSPRPRSGTGHRGMGFRTSITVFCTDRRGMLMDVASVVTEGATNIINVHSEIFTPGGESAFRYTQ